MRYTTHNIYRINVGIHTEGDTEAHILIPSEYIENNIKIRFI